MSIERDAMGLANLVTSALMTLFSQAVETDKEEYLEAAQTARPKLVRAKGVAGKLAGGSGKVIFQITSDHPLLAELWPEQLYVVLDGGGTGMAIEALKQARARVLETIENVLAEPGDEEENDDEEEDDDGGEEDETDARRPGESFEDWAARVGWRNSGESASG